MADFINVALKAVEATGENGLLTVTTVDLWPSNEISTANMHPPASNSKLKAFLSMDLL